MISVLGILGVLGVRTVSLGNARLEHAIFTPFCHPGFWLPLQVSAVRSRRSSNKTLFIRTHVATYLVSLLMCNLCQAIGGLLNIPWIVGDRVYSGVACTAQGVIKQFGNVREPFILDREGWALTLLRLDLRFSALQFPPTPSVNSFFVIGGRTAQATQSSL